MAANEMTWYENPPHLPLPHAGGRAGVGVVLGDAAALAA